MKPLYTLLIGLFLFLQNAEGQKALNVYVFIAEECPISIYMAGAMRNIAKQYEAKVNFYCVFPTSNSNYKTVHKFKEKYQLKQYESILDKKQELSKKLGASITPEAIVTNEAGEVLYRGRINDAYFAPGKMKHRPAKNDLQNAIVALSQGKAISKPWPNAIGCFITYKK